MKIRQWVSTIAEFDPSPDHAPELERHEAQLVLAFGSPHHFRDPTLGTRLATAFPSAVIAGCSGTSVISSHGSSENSLIVTAIKFDKVKVRSACIPVTTIAESEKAATDLVSALAAPDLSAILLLSTRESVNPSACVRKVREAVGRKVLVAGGLASAESDEQKIRLLHGRDISESALVGIGFYGKAFKAGYGCASGLDPFGQARRITRASGSVIFEIDGKPAAEVFGQHLGAYASDLPGSGFFFPLALFDNRDNDLQSPRTIVELNSSDGSATMSGDVSEGEILRFAHAKTQGLLDAAMNASRHAAKTLGIKSTESALTLILSDVGRKAIMHEDIDEEIDIVRSIIKTKEICGFASAGEIAPSLGSDRSRFHNESVLVLVLAES